MSHKDYEDFIRQSDMMEDEEKMVVKFAEEMEDIEIPKSLEPEAIEKMLKSKKNKKKNRFAKYVSIAAGAALVLGVTAYGMLNFGWFGPDSGNSAEATPFEEQALTAEENLKTADSYADIYECIQAYADQFNNSQSGRGLIQDLFGGGSKDAAMEESTADMAVAEATAAPAEAGAGTYSDTNTREEDVGEADIVKTDGEYIYVLNGSQLQIVDIRSLDMKEAGSYSFAGEINPSEMYIQGDKLVVFYNKTEQTETDSDEYGAGYREMTVAETFDVSDPANPKSLGQISQSGYYDSVRISDGYYYLFSTFYADWGADEEDRDWYVPLVQGELLKSDSVYLPQITKGNQFTVITSFSLSDPGKVLDKKAVMSSNGQLYVSAENIYIYENVYDKKEDYNQTSIRKVAYDKGELTGVAQTKVWGYINDSFSIDEYKGNLRVVTTVDPIVTYESDGIFLLEDSASGNVDGTSSNALYVLDEKLEVIGKIEKLAPDETVYSARLMGDVGYFVTYEQVDPLFSVDLSDPTKPTIIGELKIPGFSEYLHPYGEGLLLGIGMDADMSGITNGVKLSMFDISDPSNVTEVNKAVLEELYSTDVAYNYKAVLVDPNKNLIGFSAYGDQMHYLVYSYDEVNGFTCHLDREINGWGYSIRGLYVDDVLYLVEGYAIESFDLNTFEKIDDIVL